MAEKTTAVGVFWDIENCCVPRFMPALSVVQRIRNVFFFGHWEAEFMCVCDINKESKSVIEDLNNAQVNVVHINAGSKNAADDKLRQCLRRFADSHSPNSKVILLSSDVNFAIDLSDLRHRKRMHIILIHHAHVHEALVACAHEHYIYEDFVADIPLKPPKELQNWDLKLSVQGFPPNINLDKIKRRLLFLSNNCGGRVLSISRQTAILIFASLESLTRACKRMDGEDVFGQKITATIISPEVIGFSQSSPIKCIKNISPGGHHTLSSDRHCPAPGGPGDISVNKSSSEGGFCTPVICNDGSGGSSSTYSSNGMHNLASETNIACSQEEPLHKESYNGDKKILSQFKEEKISQSVMIQQQRCEEEEENGVNMNSTTGTVQAVSHTLTNVFPAIKSQPPAIVPFTVLDSAKTSRTVDVAGAWNLSKTVNFTYQTMYIPYIRPHTVLYPHYGGYVTTSHRPLAFHQERPRYYSTSMVPQVRNFGPRNRPHSSCSNHDDFNDMEENEFCSGKLSSENSGPVNLYVSNLDYNISSREWRKILASTFQPHIQVLGIFVRTQPDNTTLAIVKVASVEDARFAISQFHRRKIGYKRIHVSLSNDFDQTPAESTRNETISILSECKDFTTPVFKFIEQYEKRSHKSMSVSDLYKMKDVVEIIDRGGTGRMVRLVPGICPSPVPAELNPNQTTEQEDTKELPVCHIHCPEGSLQHSEAMNTHMLPLVQLQRKPFAAHVHSLLLAHNGIMPLMSFPVCYTAEFDLLPVVTSGGVSLEHLLSCVPGVEITISSKGTKVISFQENKEPPGAEPCGRSSPMLSQQMAQISREICDLLRQSSHCCLPASKFIPSYHHHFGRQCRVADYGYTKLAELFESLPHVLQVLGIGDRKVLTLSHRAQVKRFTADALKVLKVQPGKQLSTEEFPKAYEQALARPFDITHYGLAYLEDMFMDIPATSILITLEDNKTIMAIPKRDQTPEEIERTKQFALEVVDLLKHNPQCRMAFNKFIPAYHHHFGRQCRVADYGFTKLTDLFECIFQVVEIVEEQEERMLKLTAPEMRAVLAEQMMGLLREQTDYKLAVDQLLLAFQRQYGFPLRLADYGVGTVPALLGKIKHCVSIQKQGDIDFAVLRNQNNLPTLALRVLQLLMDQSGGCLPLVELCSRYNSTFGVECDVQALQEEMLDYVQISNESDDGSAVIRLTALQTLGRDIRNMLRKLGSVPLVSFSRVYYEEFSVELKPALYRYPDVSSLLRALPHIVVLTGKHSRKSVELSPILGYCMEDEEVAFINAVDSTPRYEDHLSGPLPSALPSPELRPNANIPDLMKFEKQPDYSDKMWELSAEEKRGLRTPLCRTPTSELLQLAVCSLPLPPPAEHLFPNNIPLTTIFPPPPLPSRDSQVDMLDSCFQSSCTTLSQEKIERNEEFPRTQKWEELVHSGWWQHAKSEIPSGIGVGHDGSCIKR
ncbi:meiosis regulator and mRNA stability factor 1-like isoform X2 [Pomacea canaliculata]|uniref:meiosis regulator and mRNA stability factor 1-like isoform X2 n=1 Tax=Pomacea canaliculata TaxID=400727 RepID=UPI000D73320E|nr:meiosis regulator and mRNA stability factor 1-like isoform X2 [Pomacea canaliculata]